MKLVNEINSIVEGKIDGYIEVLAGIVKPGSKLTLDMIAKHFETDDDLEEMLEFDEIHPILKKTSAKLSKEIIKLATPLAKKHELSEPMTKFGDVEKSMQVNDTLEQGAKLGLDTIFDVNYQLPMFKEELKRTGELKEFDAELKALEKSLSKLGDSYYNKFQKEKEKKETALYKQILKKWSGK